MPVSLVTQLLAAVAIAAAPQATGGGAAPTIGTPPPPAPRFDVEPFRFLVGRWRGTGMFGPSGDPVSSTMTFELANRTTMLVRGTEDAPNTYRYVATWSKEKDSGELLMLMSSSLDGPALFHSKGWLDGRMVFEPKAGVNTGPSSVRFTYVRKDDRTFDLTYEFSIGGVWHIGDKQTFTKAE